jgi:hypothetical protein
VRRNNAELHAGSIQHLAPNRARGGKDQRQADNLVEKSLRGPSAGMGTRSTGRSSDHVVKIFEHSSTGTDLAPSL